MPKTMSSCYDDAMRTIIDLPEDQVRRLAEYTACRGISRAEAVRRAVEKLLSEDKERLTAREEALKAGFGAWKGRGIDGLDYQRAIRAEWDREWDPD